MLKIKNNVDLKELEKFGYKTNGKIYSKYRHKFSFDFTNISVFVSNREIWLKNDGANIVKRATGWLKEQLDELKNAGLVEKV